jgi:beta-1,2-mannobiose phosphorylase / 1,2-beta-oligomannan phosphorylase
MFVVRRSHHNPILSPDKHHAWESSATFNWSPVQVGKVLHCFYRAEALPEPLPDGSQINMSVIGHAESKDGLHFTNRQAFITPEEDWEYFGCEDPRVTKLNGTYYIFYTALSNFPFNADGIKVAVAITHDLKKVKERHLVTPFNAKAMCLFPEKINGKMVAILSVNTDRSEPKIAIRTFDNEKDIWNHKKWHKWYLELDNHAIHLRRNEDDHVEVGAPPIKTPHGWLLIYSHINHYFKGQAIFGIEAVLLDADDPRKIIGRTSGPIMTPESTYEKYGHVPNIVFPSGALVYNGNLDIYYGATDTLGCRASVNLNNVLDALTGNTGHVMERFNSNPILEPIAENKWENELVFNPAAIELDGNIHILYRAIGDEGISRIGMAVSHDGRTIDERLAKPIYEPREPFENKGCEDARIIRMDKDLHMFYTAYNGISNPSIATTSISVSNFLARKWHTWKKPVLISRKDTMDKDACVLPEKTKMGYMVFHRLGNNICVDYVPRLDFSKYKLDSCDQLLITRTGMWDSKKVGIAAPPIQCERGWLLFYHGVAEDNIYRVGVALLDRNNPSDLIATTSAPVLVPEMKYEREGYIPNVVFPCGAVLRDDTIYLYYGGADAVVAGATFKLSTLVKMFN